MDKDLGMELEQNIEKIHAIKDAVESRLVLSPLAAQDQVVVDLDTFEPELVDVPFKRPVQLLWDWNAFLQSATSRFKDPRLAITGAVMSWTCEISALLIESLLDTL